MRHLLFIYNPKAGRRFNSALLKDIEQEFKNDNIAIVAIGDLPKQHQLDDYDTMVAIGGDGTVNTVAKLCSRYNASLAIIPRGSGDGLARHLGLKTSLQENFNTIKQNKTKTIDTAFLNHHFFVNIAGTGFEAEVARLFNDGRSRGLLGYISTITSLYRNYPEKNLEIRVDGKITHISYFSLSFANGSQWGNNFEIASNAKLDDGILELAIMRKPKWFEFHKVVQQLREKKQLDSSLLSYISAKEVVIEDAPLQWHIDGEAISIDNDITLHVQPQSLRVIVP